MLAFLKFANNGFANVLHAASQGDLQYIRRGHSGKAKVSWDKDKTDWHDLFRSVHDRN